MPGWPPDADALVCPQCGSHLPPHTRYCGACGHAVSSRGPAPRDQGPTAPSQAVLAETIRRPAEPTAVEQAGGKVRCASFLLDLAVMISPAMPLSTAGAVLGVAEVIYVVVPVAFVAVWLWQQVWQGLTGTTFGKAVLGLRLVRAADHRPPGVGATLLRSVLFAITLGLSGLPVLLHAQPRAGWHDRVSGLTVLDVTTGANPLGRRPQTTLRRSVDRTLQRVHAPVPVPASRHR